MEHVGFNMKCFKDGQELGELRMTNMSYNSNFNYNLFNVAWCLMNDWTIAMGNRSGITITSPDKM